MSRVIYTVSVPGKKAGGGGNGKGGLCIATAVQLCFGNP